MVVGDGRSVLQGNQPVVRACEHHLRTESRANETGKPQRHVQYDILFEHAVRSGGPVVMTAMARIDYHTVDLQSQRPGKRAAGIFRRPSHAASRPGPAGDRDNFTGERTFSKPSGKRSEGPGTTNASSGGPGTSICRGAARRGYLKIGSGVIESPAGSTGSDSRGALPRGTGCPGAAPALVDSRPDSPLRRRSAPCPVQRSPTSAATR